MIERNKSVITGKEGLEPLFSLMNFPVFFGCVDSGADDDLHADMEWSIDKESGVIQLIKLIPLDVLYQEQHVDGIGKTWHNYYNDFADYVISRNPVNVLEIGGGAGVLAETVTKKIENIHWTIIEPNPLHKGDEKIDVISGFFNEGFSSDKKIDAVVFSQVLEHAYEPDKFIKHISSFLNIGGKLIFAYPNLELWLKNKFTNALNFEHTMFVTEHLVAYLLEKNNFFISDKTYYKDHSIFYTAERIDKPRQNISLDNKYDDYKKIFLDFVNYHKDLIADLNEKIEYVKSPVYLFGAHIFATFLFEFGLNKSKIVALIDNSELKQGRRLYGTKFIIETPEILRDIKSPNVILKAGIYNDEISKQLKDINPTVNIW